MRTEIWKDIPGFEGLYQCSSYGRVKSLQRVIKRKNYYDKTINERVLKPYLRKRDGYYDLTLGKNGIKTVKPVHKFVAMTFMPEAKGKEIDHIDRNRTNNMLENLRTADRGEQCRNTTKRKNVTSIYKGVCWDKKRKSWRVEIAFNKKRITVGNFSNERVAAEKYDNMAKILFGEFASLNLSKSL